jgi:hypothetical protein
MRIPTSPGGAVTGDRYTSVRGVLRAAIGPFLILVTPFVVFLQYQGYRLLAPDVMVILLVMAGLALVAGAAAAISPVVEAMVLAGLLTLFVDIQFDPPKGTIGSAATFLVLTCGLWFLRRHGPRIVRLMMATVLASSFIVPHSSSVVAMEPMPFQSRDQQASGRETLPLILHLILDEHIGFEGMPARLTPDEFVRDARSFFERHRFLLFGRAYSEHRNTYRSVGHLVNLQPGSYVPQLLEPGSRTTWAVTRNSYFNRLAQLGYAIRVYQSDYLDLCADRTSAARCQTYVATSLPPLQAVVLPASEKARVVASMYLNQTNLYLIARDLYKRARQRVAPTLTLPAWNWERDRIGPLAVTSVLESLARDLSKAQRGDFIMAHLMMPHHPYVYRANCELRPPEEWLVRMDRDAPADVINTPDSRAKRYALYFEQARCVYRKLDELMAAIPPSLRRDAIVIIHGDHGSRISLTEPELPGGSPMSAEDYADNYSTLFAVRSPYLNAGYDRQIAPITCLMRTLVESHFRSVSELETCDATPTVFMSENGRVVAMPLPAFGPVSPVMRAAEKTN